MPQDATHTTEATLDVDVVVSITEGDAIRAVTSRLELETSKPLSD
jgi:hypothetical protein